MLNIIVVFSKRENAVNIRNILVRAGMNVSAVCLTGAKALQYADTWGQGIVVCGYKLQDMQYTELRELLPEQFEMLLAAPPDKWMDSLPPGVVGLPLPIKVHDLVSTLEMMVQTIERKRRKRRESVRKRSAEETETINQAKALLMERNHMSEEEAHRYLQKNSMETGTNILETAQMVLMILDD